MAQSAFDFTDEASLIETIIPGFIFHVRRALARGVLQGYRTEEASLLTIRGRLRVSEQIRRRYGVAPPAEVQFDEYTEDIEENRLLRAAIRRLLQLRLRADRLRWPLRQLDNQLAGVAVVEYDPRRLPEIRYSRLNERYRPAVTLARLILESSSFDLRHGDVSASAFLIDMNKVFEDFVVLALREALGVTERTFVQGARGRSLWLDVSHRVRLEPDVSWWDANHCSFVGDVKYKRITVEGVVHPDLYQLLAYTVATGLGGGLLIYAAGEAESITHEVALLGKRLEVASIDLRGEPDQILKTIETLARRIRNAHAGAGRQAA